jgi:hypothetical protein
MTTLVVAVDAHGDRGGLEAVGGSAGDHHRPVVVGYELAGLVWGHGALLIVAPGQPPARSLPQFGQEFALTAVAALH